MLKIILIGFVLSIISFPSPSFAQYPFGKNKVIYSKKDWKVLQTEHVDIYHYPSERNLILLIAPMVEETYREYQELFGIEFRNRLPLVFYSSHYDFQQTNIIPSLISDYTAGFTDLIKGRIAVPFTGSIGNLRHVVRHEMVHAFMLEKIDQVMNARGKYAFSHPPLWLIEGMAEYIASPEANTRSHMFVRDALLNGKLPDLTNIWRIEGSFMMYKEGEAVVRYIARNFGDEAVINILDNWWKSDRLSAIFENTFNMSLEELSDAFMKSIKRRYFPAILYNVFAPEAGIQITKARSFHSRPVVANSDANSLEIYSLCAKHGMINICRISRDNWGKTSHEIIIEGGRSSSLESIPAFRSKMEVHGDTLVFVSKSQARDVIYLWDTRGNRKIDGFTFESLSMISSPTLSPEGSRVVFSAIDTTGMMDLYVFDMVSGMLERLTNDPFSEENPDFHPEEELILFSSDRCLAGQKDGSGIYMLDLRAREITPMLCGGSADTDPEWSPDGNSFLFTSDMGGIFNVYLYNHGTVSRQTNVLGGASVPSFVPDGSGFIANCYYRGEFQVFQFKLKGEKASGDLSIARTDTSSMTWNHEERGKFQFETKDYSMKLGLDLLGTGIAIDPDFGEVGNGAQIVLSDILGNHQFYAFIGNTSQGADDFWKRLNVGITYVNLSHRLHYLAGIFHLTTFWGDYFSLFRSERRYGGVIGASYPFSKFSRMEGSLVIRAIERESDFNDLLGNNPRSVLATTFLTYVADNTVWTIGGPLKGTRYYVTGGNTIDLRGRGFESTSMHTDLRKYFRITDRVLLAGRFINRNSWGGDLQLFYLGGPWDLRGYDFRRFAGKSIYLINSELRFPLIDRFSLSFPFGTIEMPLLRGALYFDVGKVTRFIENTGWMGSLGAGIELNLGYAPVIRVNFTRTTDFDSISSDTRFGLFIGYNY